MNKKIYSFFGFLLLAASVIFIAGCGTDPTISDTTQMYTRVTGSVYGIKQGNVVEVYANGLEHLKSTLPDIPVIQGIYYPTSTSEGTFEVNNVPANDTIYIEARQHDASDSEDSISYSYGRIKVGTNAGYVVVTFEAPATVDAICKVPNGFNLDEYWAYVSKDDKPVFKKIPKNGDYVADYGNSFTINKLPKLLQNDSYMIYVSEYNTTNLDSLERYFYYISAESHTFDMSTPEVPTSQFIKFPPEGTIFSTGVPTFEWQQIRWADKYIITVYTSSDIRNPIWKAVTTETKIRMPTDIVTAAGKGTFYWQVAAVNYGTDACNIFFNGNTPSFTVQ